MSIGFQHDPGGIPDHEAIEQAHVVLAARGDESIAIGTQKLGGSDEGSTAKGVEERQFGACLGSHQVWASCEKAIFGEALHN